MQVKLTQFDLEVLRQQALESLDLEDGGEAFVEEAVSRVSAEDLELIEEMSEEPPELFFQRLFEVWTEDEEEQDDLGETLFALLEEIDIELDLGDVDEEVIDDSGEWGDVEPLDDDDDAEFS